MQHKRSNKLWTINETLKLQREYELLGMDVMQIASAHERSDDAIAHRLEHEGFIEKWSDARGYMYKELNLIVDQLSDSDVEVENESSDGNLGDLISSLDKRINELYSKVSKIEQTVLESNASMSLLFMSKKNLKSY